MLTLTRAKNSRGKAGEPIPTVFKSWDASGVHIRQGQLALVAAAPGVGKSLVSLSIAMNARVPAYYFSADTDAFTMYVRSAAMVTGYSVDDIEHAIKTGVIETIDAKLDGNDHIRFNFDASPSVDDIDEELQAFAAAYGEWPQLVVVDNISNVFDPNSGDGYQALEGVCDFLHERARETGSAFVALHHVTGDYDDGIKPVPLSGLRGKISKVPELIITLNRDPSAEYEGVQKLHACPVKNRTGKADPSGGWSLPLTAQMNRMKLEG